jgi:hypothetical protein
VERGWVTHVQFQPGRNDVILFNHEWPADCGIRRIWLWDGQRIRRLREEGQEEGDPSRSHDDWVCHEVWSRDGHCVVYHGTYAAGAGPLAGRSFVGRVSPAGGDALEISFAPEFRRYGHFTLGSTASRLVSDGYAEYDDAPAGSARGGAWISLLDVDWDRRALRWTPLCRHCSSWASQDAHPHPIFSHAGNEVLFTSDVEGRRAIFSVPVAD